MTCHFYYIIYLILQFHSRKNCQKPVGLLICQISQAIGVGLVAKFADWKWNTHIQQNAAKANKSLCFIRINLKLLKVQSQTIKRTSISNPNKTQIRILLHCLGSSQKRKHKLSRKGTVRYTCNRHHNTSSVSEMLNTMNWQETRQFGTKTFRYRWKKVSNRHQSVKIKSIVCFRDDPALRKSGLKQMRP